MAGAVNVRMSWWAWNRGGGVTVARVRGRGRAEHGPASRRARVLTVSNTERSVRVPGGLGDRCRLVGRPGGWNAERVLGRSDSPRSHRPEGVRAGMSPGLWGHSGARACWTGSGWWLSGG